MELKLNCESAREALEIVTRVTGADHANLEIRRRDVYLSAAGNNRNIRVLVKAEIVAPGKSKGFGFNTFTLGNILKGRAEVSLTIEENEIGFKSLSKGSKFSGRFHPVPFEDISIVEDDDTTEVKIKGTTMTALLEAVKRVSLSNLFTADPMTLFVRFDKTGLYATVYDSYHLAFSHNSAVVNDERVEFSVGLPLFDTLGSVARGQDYTLSVGSVYVSAKSLGFELSMPTLQSADNQSFEQAETFVSALNVKNSKTLSIAVEELNQTLDNLSAVSDGNTGIVVEEEKGVAKFSLRSNFGNAVERRKIELSDWGDSRFTISPALFRDVISCYPSERVRLHFQNEVIIFYDETGSTRTAYTCLLM